MDVPRDPTPLVLLRAQQVRQQAFAFGVGPAQLFESRVELHGAFDHGRLQRQVLHHQLVLQSPDLLELAPVVIEQPRVVQPNRGVGRELLDDLDRPARDRVPSTDPLDHEDAQPEPARQEQRHDQEVPCVGDQGSEARIELGVEPADDLGGTRGERPFDDAVHPGRDRSLVRAPRREEREVVHG